MRLWLFGALGAATIATAAMAQIQNTATLKGWAPGAGREGAPGSQAELGALVQAWIDTGAECPD